jgi:murein DD-endopeptidase MepM/ murein hydrolase activator NlpD
MCGDDMINIIPDFSPRIGNEKTTENNEPIGRASMKIRHLNVAIAVAMILMLLGANLQSAAAKESAVASYTTPPANFFKFPFATGRAWRMTGGPHPYDGKNGIFTSIDFKPSWHQGCSLPNNNKDWVVAAAPGKVIYDANKPYLLKVDHGNGWVSEYMHLDSIQIKSGTVARDQKLGYPSCKGGQFTGGHVHFTLYYNNIRQPINKAVFEGWQVEASTTVYGGCIRHTITKQKVCQEYLPVSETPDKVFRSMRTAVRILNVNSNKVLTVSGDSKEDFADIIQSAWTGRASQKWYLIPLTDSNNLGYYTIQSVNNISKCFDIRDHSYDIGAALQQYNCKNYNDNLVNDNRKFKFINVSGTQFYIQAKHSNLVLDVPSWSTDDVAIWQWEMWGQANQYWIMTLR